MRPNLPFLLAASNALLKPGGLLRWKVQLVKDAKLSLPLTEVMKIARLISPLLNAPCQSSPRPRLRHGRRLALFFLPNQTRKSYTLFFALSLTLLPLLLIFFLSNFPNCSCPRESSFGLCRLPEIPLFPFFSQRPCVAEPEATFLSSAVTCAQRSVTRLFALLSPALNFLQLPPTFLPPLPLAQTSCLSHAKAPSSLWHGFSSSHLQSLLVFAFLSFHLKDIFYYSHTQDGKASRPGVTNRVPVGTMSPVKAI